MEKKEFFPNNFIYLAPRFIFSIIGPCLILMVIRGMPIYFLFLTLTLSLILIYFYSNRIVIGNEYILGPGDKNINIKIPIKDADIFFIEPKVSLYTAFLPISAFIFTVLVIFIFNPLSSIPIALPCPCQLIFLFPVVFLIIGFYKFATRDSAINPKELLYGSIVIRGKTTPKEISLPYVTFTQNTIEEMKSLLHVQ